MNNKDIFAYVRELEYLYIHDVLLEYIYPRVFVCEDMFNNKYLLYEVSSENNKDIWLAAKISENEYHSLINSRNPVQKAYEKKTGTDLFMISIQYGEKDSVELSFGVSEWLNKLPTDPIYAE